MELTAKRVNEIFNDCLFQDTPAKGTEYIPGKGIVVKVGFNPVKIEKHAQEIHDLLHELRDEFIEDKGGGYSFLMACEDKNGHHWAEHRTMDELFVLGFASGYAKFTLPEYLWGVLPGGMPYIVIFNERKPVEKAVL